MKSFIVAIHCWPELSCGFVFFIIIIIIIIITIIIIIYFIIFSTILNLSSLRKISVKHISKANISSYFAACSFCTFTASGCSTPTLLKTLKDNIITKKNPN